VATYLTKAIELVDIQIEWTEKQINSGQIAGQYTARLKWVGSIIEGVELVYALQTTGYIYCHNKKVTLKQLFTVMGEVFSFKVAEYANYFMNIKSRTDRNRTKFTDILKDAIQERMNEADSKPARK
jgi:hypothetical protein